MAPQSATTVRIGTEGLSTFTISWTLPTISDTGTAVDLHSLPGFVGGMRVVSVQCKATAYTGGSVVSVTGSNDGTNFVTLQDQAAAALTFSADGIKQNALHTRYLACSAATGTGTGFVVTALVK